MIEALTWLRRAIAGAKSEWVRYRAASALRRHALEPLRRVKREVDAAAKRAEQGKQ